MNIPFVSQLMGNPPTGGNNCGPACLSMALAYRGVIAPTQGAMRYVADIVRDGVPDGIGMTGGYTTLQQLMACAAWFDQPTLWIESWVDVHASLFAGEPVVLLCDNTALWPRQYPKTAAFNAHHFIVLTGYTPPQEGAPPDITGTFLVNDPLSVYAQGPAPYTAASLFAATELVGGVQGIALVPLPEEDMSQGIIDELNHQVAALRSEIDGLKGLGTERDSQIADLRQEIAGKDSRIGALEHDVVAPLEQRVAQMEEQVRQAVALAGKATAQRPARVVLEYPPDGELGYVPEREPVA